MPMPMPSPSHTPAMPARHSDVRPRDVSSRLLGGWAAGLAGMRGLALAAAEAGGLRPEAGKLALSSTSSGYAGREIPSPPPTAHCPCSQISAPIGHRACRGDGIAARWGRASRAPLLVCLCACVLVCFHLPRFHPSMRPCCHVPVALPIPSLNPGCFSSPSVFRTRTHVLVLVLAALSSFLGPDVSCRPHIVTGATLSTAAELLKGQESR
jgi:hypothetical protein